MLFFKGMRCWETSPQQDGKARCTGKRQAAVRVEGSAGNINNVARFDPSRRIKGPRNPGEGNLELPLGPVSLEGTYIVH